MPARSSSLRCRGNHRCHRPTSGAQAQVQLLQGSSIELAARGAGKVGEEDGESRHHVGRQALSQKAREPLAEGRPRDLVDAFTGYRRGICFPDLLSVAFLEVSPSRGVGLRRHYIGHQVAVPGGPLPHQHRRLPHLRVLAEGGLDLPGLDAEAANLDLAVLTAEVFDAAVFQVPGQVAGGIDAGAAIGEGVG